MQNLKELDTEYVRSHFSALNGKWAFLENAGGTLTANQVIQRVQNYMSHFHVQPNHFYKPSQDAGILMANGQAVAAEMIGAKQDEVMISPNTTASVFFLANSIRRLFSEGDEIIVTDLDHEANNGAWRKLAEFGLKVKEWKFCRDNGSLEIETLEPLLSSKTRMVCFTHCSNITGAINDISLLVDRIHDAGAMACVDGVAYAPHRPIDVKLWDVDFYFCSLYKIYGPHLGIFYAKKEHIENATGNNHYFLDDNLPLKLNPGGPNHELTSGIVGIGDYFSTLHDHHCVSEKNTLLDKVNELSALISNHEEKISQPLVDFLTKSQSIELFGPKSADSMLRAPIFSFDIKGHNPAEVVKALDLDEVGIGSGHFYAPRCLKSLGCKLNDGLIRVSLVHYNDSNDVIRLIEALEKLI